MKDEALARRVLELSLDDSTPRQLRPNLVQYVSGEHPRLAWDFYKAHRAALDAIVDAPSRLEYPIGIASNSSDPAMVAELQAFTRDYPVGARPKVDSAIATITLRAQTIRERMPAVETWIARHSTVRGGGGHRASRG